MTITWRQLQGKISQMTKEQLDQDVLLRDCEGWSPASDLKFMTEEEVSLYYKMWGSYNQDSTQLGTPFLNSGC
jgi:hypothetical protein